MMIIKLRGGISVEKVSAGERVLIPFCVVVSKNTESHSIYFKYKYSVVSIVYLHNIFLFPVAYPYHVFIICALRVVGPSDVFDPSSRIP